MVVPVRSTEGFGGKQDATIAAEKNAETRKARGRPKGATGKPKGILQAHIAQELLGIIRPLLPESEYNEIRDAIKKGKSISTLKEAKILLALMGPPIWQRLVEEARPKQVDPSMEDEIGLEPTKIEFQRDTSERIKVMKDIMGLVHKMETDLDEGADTTKKPVMEVLIRNQFDAGRFSVLTGSLSGSMGGNGNGLGRSEIDAGTLSDSLSERQFDSEDSEEVEATGILDSYRSGSDSLSDSKEEL